MNYEEFKKSFQTNDQEESNVEAVDVGLDAEVSETANVEVIAPNLEPVEQPKANLAALVFGGSLGLMVGVVVIFFTMSSSDQATENAEPIPSQAIASAEKITSDSGNVGFTTELPKAPEFTF